MLPVGLIGIGAWFLSLGTIGAQQAVYKNGMRQGRIVVKFKNEAALKQQASAAAMRSKSRTAGDDLQITGAGELNRLASQLKVSQIAPLFTGHPKFEKRFKREGLDCWYAIDYDAQESPVAVIQALRNTPGIDVVEAEPELILPKYKVVTANPESVVQTRTADAAVNDPYFPDQWHYQNTGQYSGTPGADVNVVEAWKKRMDASSVIVAVMDQGVDHSHEDLRANMWVNEKELFGTPGVDDDGNGLIDDVYGFDFGNGYAQIEKGRHGTHVAGTVAAVSNNGVGVAGVAGGDGSGNGARIMTLPVFGSNETRVANCYVYAADNGALISQNSWGYSMPGMYSEAFETGIRYFKKYAGCDNDGNQLPGALMQGGVVIFASGNNDMDGAFFPCNMEEVIAVSSVDASNKPATYTNYDTWVDVSSYGGLMDERNELGVLSTLPGNEYGYMEGTSMACPHVSGVAALSLAELGGPGFTNEMLRNYITLTTRDNEDNYTSKHRGKMGSGIVDALRALTKNDGVPPLKIVDATVSMISNDYMCLTFTAPSKTDGTKVEGYRVYLTNQTDGKVTTLSFPEKKMPGDTQEFTIFNLLAKTAYKIQVASYDIWGVESEYTDPLEFTTVARKGQLTYQGTTKRFKTADYAQENSWTFDVVISNNSTNEEEGGLYWRADGYNYSHENAIMRTGGNSMAELSVAPFTFASDNSLLTNSTEKNVYEQAGFVSYLTNRSNLNAESFIGEMKENGVMYPSSAAQKFVVPESYTKGFLLTHFDVAVRTGRFWQYDDEVAKPENLSLTFQVYRGGDVPRQENLIYSGMVYDQADLALRVMSLPFHPYFAPKESFWIVMHADARYKYPLGINHNGARPENSLYSSDGGKTWSTLNKNYTSATNPVFTMSALSRTFGQESFVTLSPSSGYLGKGEKRTVKATIDFDRMKEGVDTSMVVFNTDGRIVVNRQTLTAVVTLTRNDLDMSFSEECYENGMVSLGDAIIKKVRVYNHGMGHMPIESITLTNTADFRLVSAKPAMIASKDSIDLELEFKPTGLGPKSTTVEISGRGTNVSALMIGTCVEAPEAFFTPDRLEMNVLGSEEMTGTFTVENRSNYSLRYELPQFLGVKDQLGRIETQDRPAAERTDTTDLSGNYIWVDNNMGKEYKGSDWVEISQTGEELTRYCDGIKKFRKVELPFTFRFYDRELRYIYAGINGILRCDTTSHSLNVPSELPSVSEDPETPEAFNGIIASLWVMDATSGHYRDTRFYYQVFDDCVIFQFTGSRIWLTDGNPTNYQVVLYPDGSFEFRFKELFGFMTTMANSFLVGWSSPDGTDGKSVHFFNRRLPEELAASPAGIYSIKVTPVAFDPFKVVENEKYQGVVAPKSSRQITFRVSPKDLQVGTSLFGIRVLTNDPLHKDIRIPVVFNKQDQLGIEFTSPKVDLGQIICDGIPVEKTVSFFNVSKTDGKVQLRIADNTNVKFSNNSESIIVDTEKKRVKTISLLLTGSVNTEIHAFTEDGKTPLDTLAITAEQIPYYNIHAGLLDKESLYFNMEAGAKQTQQITIKADEKSYRSKVFTPGFISVSKADKAGRSVASGEQLDFTGYRWMVSSDPRAPQFIWNDISKTGTRLDLIEDLDYEGHQLPFKFPFYGVEYDKMYVAPSGRMSPYPLGWDVMWDFIPPVRMPDADLKVPVISAMWNRQWYSDQNKEAGIFYQILDDRMIVQFHQFQYDWVVTNGFCSYQLVLYKDGTVQFIYLDIENCDLKDQVTIGLQGVAQSSELGYTYSLTGSTPVKNRTTITAKPMYGPFTVEAGETLVLNVEADNYGFKTGEFEDNIIFVSENNAIENTIPVTIKVDATVSVGFKESDVNFGSVINGDKIDRKTVTVINNGNEDTQINALYFEGEDSGLFEIKRMYTEIEEGLFVEKYEEINYPFTLNAFATETFAVFATPHADTKVCEATLLCESKSNTTSVPVKMTSLRPARIKVETEAGMSMLQLDLAGRTNAFDEAFRINYQEGVNPLEFDWDLKVVNKPLPAPQKMRTAGTRDMGPFSPVVIRNTPLSTVQTQSVKPMAISSEAIQPFNTISVIGDTPPVAMIGTQSLGDFYGLSCFVKMTTEEYGFLLSHLRIWTNTLGRDTSSVTVRIYNDCPEPSREHLIYEKQHQLKMNVSVVGEVVLPLEYGIPFAPNQEFWVEVYYGVKLTMPMAVANIPNGVTDNRNYYRIYNAQTGEWNDLKPYPAYFAIWALQETYSDLTRWISPSMAKRLADPGESLLGNLTVNPLHLPLGNIDLDLTARTTELTVTEPLRISAHKFTEPEWVLLPEKPMIIKEGDSVTFRVKAVDPDGLPVSYRLKSAVDGVTVRKLDGDTLEVHYVAPYTAPYVSNLNIEARTDRGVSVRRISVGNINVNRAPIGMPVKPIILNLNGMGSITLPTYYFFVDPDNDALQYGASTSSGGVGLQLNENGFIFTPLYEDVVDITLSATDGEYLATTHFIVNVVRALNTPPTLIKQFTNTALYTGAGLEYDLNEYFTDHDGDSISYEVWAANPDIASVGVADDILTIVTKAPGITAIGIRAKDAKNGETLASFAIRAVGEIGDNQNQQPEFIVLAPNPASTQSRISYTGPVAQNSIVTCEVRDVSGALLVKRQMLSDSDESVSTVVSVDDLVPGIYMISILQDNEVISTEKLIVKK